MKALISWVFGLIGIQKSKILNVAFLMSYQEHFQPDKYCLSRISTSRIINLKKYKIQFVSLSCLFSFFDFCLQNLCQFEKVPIKCPRQFLYYIEFICRRACEKKSSLNSMSLVWLPDIQKFFWKIYCVQVLKSFAGRNNFLEPSLPWIIIFSYSNIITNWQILIKF